jgi:dUTP pyrophosphatase
MNKLLWKKLTNNAQLPKYATEGSASVDLVSLIKHTIQPYETFKVHTGLACAIPENHVGIIAPRSSLGVKGLILANTIGVIDSDYRGEIIVALYNRSENEYYLEEGNRIAQMFIIPCPQMINELVNELPETVRGEGGFGSTGK